MKTQQTRTATEKTPRAGEERVRPDGSVIRYVRDEDDDQKMVDHYRKHGREFGPITMEQYVRKAQELRDRPAGGTLLESVRPDGVATRFDRGSGDFIAFNRDGTIRTYFRPADGEAYYQRQLRRKH